MKIPKGFFIFIFCVFCAGAKDSQAADLSEARFERLSQMVMKLQETVQNQQLQIDALKRAASALQPPVSSPVPPAAQPNAIGPRWNPEIGAVADTVLTSDSPRVDDEGADRISVRELELVLGSAVDPYSRLDATLSFSDFEEAGLEEAYLTRFDLPFGATGRFGRFKPRAGKALAVHRDSLDTVDEPLVIQRYFGVEGMNKSGADLRKPLNLGALPFVQELSFGVLEGGNGEGGTVFGEARRRPTVYSHLKNYWDVGEASGLEIGLSHLWGSRDEDSTFETGVFAGDATWTHPLDAARSLKLQGETFFVNRSESFVEVDDGSGSLIREDVDGTTLGAYALADFRFHPQWSTGFRYDYVELINDPVANPDHADRGYTGYLTFHQSEFARWRFQFTHLDLATADDDDRVMIQGTFAIGEHKHKIQ